MQFFSGHKPKWPSIMDNQLPWVMPNPAKIVCEMIQKSLFDSILLIGIKNIHFLKKGLISPLLHGSIQINPNMSSIYMGMVPKQAAWGSLHEFLILICKSCIFSMQFSVHSYASLHIPMHHLCAIHVENQRSPQETSQGSPPPENWGA